MSSDLTGCRFFGYATQLKEITEVMKACSEERKGSSLFLVGPHGVGKTALINAAWNSLPVKPQLIVLDGVLCHDGHVAVKTFADALNLDFSAFQSRGVTDELVILFDALHGRSHRSEKDSDSDGESATLAQSRIDQSIVQRGVVLVLDEIDAFCVHRNQTFLYEAFECSMRTQGGASPNATPLCVIGTTTRSDAVELLEKRIRSRFSQRTVWMRANELPQDAVHELLVQTVVDFCANLQTRAAATKVDSGSRRKSTRNPGDSTNATGRPELESAMRSLLENVKVQQELKWLNNLTCDVRVVRKLAGYLSASRLSPDAFVDAVRRSLGGTYTPLVDAIGACSAVELGALIAAHRVADRTSLRRQNASTKLRRSMALKQTGGEESEAVECVTFEQLEREYGAFVSRAAAANQPLGVATDRQVLSLAFDRLVACGLLLPIGATSESSNIAASVLASGMQRPPVVLGLSATDLRRALDQSPHLSTELRQFMQSVNMSLA